MARGALHPKMSKLQDILLCHFGELKDARDAAEAAAAGEAPRLTARPITTFELLRWPADLVCT